MNINKTPVQTSWAQSKAEDADTGRRGEGERGQWVSLRVRQRVAAAAFDLQGRLDVDDCQRRPCCDDDCRLVQRDAN